MLSLTKEALKEFDNAHDFERMCADILNSLGYQHVTPIAPQGGNDGGKDIEYTTSDKSKGLACVSLEKKYKTKFISDLNKHKKGDYGEYIVFSNQYITAKDKKDIQTHCGNRLDAYCEIKDIECLRSLLDTTFQQIRKKYLSIKIEDDIQFKFKITEITHYRLDTNIINDVREEIKSIRNTPPITSFLNTSISIYSDKSKDEKLQLLNEYLHNLIIFKENLTNKFSFNIQVTSTAKNDDLEIIVSAKNDSVHFSFDDEVEPIERPVLSYSQHFITPPISSVSYHNENDFYATLIHNNKAIQCNIRTLNAEQPKLLFDSTLYAITNTPLDKICLQLDIFSSKLKSKQSHTLNIDLTKGVIKIVS
jgi:hypothetical protein